MRKNMYEPRTPYIGMYVKCKRPEWENKIGTIYAINRDGIMVKFGNNEPVKLCIDELIGMTML